MSLKDIQQRREKKARNDARLVMFREALFKHMSKHVSEVGRQRVREGRLTVLRSQPPAAGRRRNDEVSVGIVGGGMAGLYAGLLLQELGIRYHIFEASGERLGGRVLTHYFNNIPHNYAELGAMRFPDSILQDRLFKTWDYLNRTASTTHGGRVIPKIPYILHDPTTNLKGGNLLCFNGRRPATRNEVEQDNSLLGFDDFFQGSEWDYFKENGKLKPAQELLDNAVKRFVDLFESEGVDKAWAELLKYDAYSARGYLQEFGDGTRPYPSKIVDYIESVLTYTGMYNLSFVELVLDQFSFAATERWYAMEGGTSRITEELAGRIIPGHITMGAQVFKLDEEGDSARIHFRRGPGMLAEVRSFDRVIETLPFNALKFIETPDTWSAAKRQAMRMLKMTNAVKIALGFKSRFWEQPGPYSQGMKGGQSDTDLNVRSVVYPSFGIGEPGPAYLLGSYCWQDDADKFLHLSEEQLLDAALRDVARLHGEDIVYREYLGHGASVVWGKQAYAGNAFEYFASGQFGEMFLAASEPEGRFHFAGEHLDMVHYWIAGAFNSAFRTVWEVLILEGLSTPENLDILKNALGGGEIFPTMIPHIAGAEWEAEAARVA